MSGNNENHVLKILKDMDYQMGVDFIRQHPIGGMFVIDFAFVNEQIAIEVDGKTHLAKKQRLKDEKRDKFLHKNNWISIRFNDVKLETKQGERNFRQIVRSYVEERRTQYEQGRLYPIDIPEYEEE